jgi:hypothetical protein
MWAHLPDDEAAAAERMVAEGQYPFVPLDEEAGLRYFYMDGESMAEGGVDRALREMAPGLRACGIELRIETVNVPVEIEEGDYIVAINGRRCVVWRAQDWAAHRAWLVSVVRPLAVVNDLLAEAGETKRLFTLNAGGNDGFAWLLDPPIVAAVADSGLVRVRSVPALPCHD